MNRLLAYYNPLPAWLANTPGAQHSAKLLEKIRQILTLEKHGDLTRWNQLLENLPPITATNINASSTSICIGTAQDGDIATRQQLEKDLRSLHPWRKGPYDLFGIRINTEWRSDWKWERLSQHIQPLTHRYVLDIGCGNGYHAWRMAGAGARTVLGIDPTLLFIVQYQAIRHYSPHLPVHILPLGIDDLPETFGDFDSVFSMGVLYHRRSPIDHLYQLRNLLRSGGELILETLVIEGGAGQILLPKDRYAQMRNVWFIPSCATLADWLQRCGFRNIRLININKTTLEEQRSTDWMTFQSLSDFLDPADPTKTIEGYPAPMRAIYLAENA